MSVLGDLWVFIYRDVKKNMKTEDVIKVEFEAFVQRHKETVKKIGGLFCAGTGYDYNDMMCNLTTYLWTIFLKREEYEEPLDDEGVWVFSALYRKAMNMIRDERCRRKYIVYSDTLPDIADECCANPLTERLYYLIGLLDKSDQKLLAMYLDQKTAKEMSEVLEISERQVARRMKKIRDKLIEMNKIVE